MEIKELLPSTFPLEYLTAAVATPTSIFKLPESLCNNKPEAYFPRCVAMGPLHHYRPELHKMEFFKFHNRIEFQTQFSIPDFNQLVDQLQRSDLRIRACFDTSLKMESKALASIMAIDGVFFINLLNSSFNESFMPLRIKLPLLIFNDQTNFKPNSRFQYEVLTDLLMLENQIPFLVLNKILPSNLRDKFPLQLYRFCRSILPFQLHTLFFAPQLQYLNDTTYTLSQLVEQSHHLLHFLCLLFLSHRPKMTSTHDRATAESERRPIGFIRLFLNVSASVLNIPFLAQLNEAMGFIESFFELLQPITQRSSNGGKTPIIPSASKLLKLKISFKPAEIGSMISTKFDKKTATLFLPAVTLDAFSEVLLRNMVAFEAKAKLNSPCLIQYITLMSELIVTVKDVKILREKKIISNHLEDDEQVVKLFHEIWESAECLNETDVLEIHCADETKGQEKDESSKPLLSDLGSKKTMDELKGTVREINEYYGNHWRIKMKKFIYKYVRPAVKVLFFVVVFLLGALLATRLVCSFFGCPKIFKAH